MLARGLLGNRGAFGDRRGPQTDRETTTGRAGCPDPSRNQRECYRSRAECKRYAGALCNGPALMSRLACEQAGPGAGPLEASPSSAPAQDGAWSTARSPAGGLTTSSAVQPDSQGAPSSPVGTAGSLPQSWESGAGWAGTAARQRQVPETTSSHANSTAVTGLLRTCSSLGQFARLSSAAAEPDGGTNRFPSLLDFGESPVNRASIWRDCWVDHTCTQSLGGPRRAGVPAGTEEHAGKAAGGSGGESRRCSTNSKVQARL